MSAQERFHAVFLVVSFVAFAGVTRGRRFFPPEFVSLQTGQLSAWKFRTFLIESRQNHGTSIGPKRR
jgi:hypothetical protein